MGSASRKLETFLLRLARCFSILNYRLKKGRRGPSIHLLSGTDIRSEGFDTPIFARYALFLRHPLCLHRRREQFNARSAAQKKKRETRSTNNRRLYDTGMLSWAGIVFEFFQHVQPSGSCPASPPPLGKCFHLDDRTHKYLLRRERVERPAKPLHRMIG